MYYGLESIDWVKMRQGELLRQAEHARLVRLVLEGNREYRTWFAVGVWVGYRLVALGTHLLERSSAVTVPPEQSPPKVARCGRA